MTNLTRAWCAVGMTAVLASSSLTFGQEIRGEGPGEAHATIWAESKQNVQLDPTKLRVEVGGRTTQLQGLTKVQPGAAQVAILIDDGLRRSFGNQLDDIKKFVNALPAGTQVLVGYMQNGTVRSGEGFSADHAAVANSVRLPMSMPGQSASPYFCLSDFVKRWPSDQTGPRFVMMLTNGVDPYNGSVSPMNQDSPYVQSAITDAQRAGASVYSIAYGDAGMRGGAASFSGQNYLAQVSEETGGRSFWNGMGSPVSLQPFLKQFRSAIAESYTATFETHGRGDSGRGLERVKITTSPPGVKLHVASAVPIGPQGQ